MKSVRGRDGSNRLWFSDGEIDSIMDSELQKASLFPTADSPVTNLERFIEKYLGARLDQYANLESSVLGTTEFFTDSPPTISVNAKLTGSALDEDETPPGILGRFRATLAHEAAHVVLHRSFVEFGSANLDLFDQRSSESKPRKLQRCDKRTASFRRVADWREFQANQGMAALLMPRLTFLELARREIARLFPGHSTIPAGQQEKIAAKLAGIFKVSKHAASIRLETLALLATGQGVL
jgi:IrrE N-terminal-like domain